MSHGWRTIGVSLKTAPGMAAQHFKDHSSSDELLDAFVASSDTSGAFVSSQVSFEEGKIWKQITEMRLLQVTTV